MGWHAGYLDEPRSQEDPALNVLVSAASRHGATVEVAATIGEALRTAGLQVFVLAPDEVDRLDGYDAAVLGSAVYVGRWLEPARDLVERHKVALSRIPVWLFSSGPIGDPLKPAEDPADAAPLAALVGARAHRTFAGCVDRGRLSFGERAVMAAVRAPEGDYRAWDAIEAWAQDIAAALLVERGPD
jgi:menaquinone-dependent protoporphyrinogen oxidase